MYESTSHWTDAEVLAFAREIVDSLDTEPLNAVAVRARASLGAERGPVALTLASLWRRHAGKFSGWPEFVADRVAAEQATSERIARRRAERFAGMCVLELCTGAGSDATALSREASSLVALDIRRERLAWARFNVARYGAPERVRWLCADAFDATRLFREPFPFDVVFIDPDRRAGARRAIRPDDYVPGPALWEELRQRAPAMAVKVAPGIDYGDIPPGATPEFVEERGECREATLWFGDLRPRSRCATVLSADRADTISAHDSEEQGISGISRVLYDPGPATVRAHLVTHLAARLGAPRIDPLIAYLTSDALRETPFAQAFVVDDVWPFKLRALKTALRERGIGALEIRMRRFPMSPEELRATLGLEGDRSAVLVCTKVADRPVVALCHRPDNR